MLYIQKQKPERQLEIKIAEVKSSPEWRNATTTDEVRACFDRLSKELLRSSILKEQHYLCAYCMRRIENDAHTTVDHYIPLSKSKENALNYNNMICVCDGGRNVKLADGEERALCCDASKKDEELIINPLMKNHMNQIKYMSTGKMYTENVDFDADINDKLYLNGLYNRDGSWKCDTATGLMKGRRDAYEKYYKMMEVMGKNGKLTSLMVEKVMRNIWSEEKREEFSGVLLFFLKRKYKQLIAQGK